jgi:hypothetical protein
MSDQLWVTTDSGVARHYWKYRQSNVANDLVSLKTSACQGSTLVGDPGAN